MNFQIERLKQLPLMKDEIWQGGLARIPIWTMDDNGQKAYRPWIGGWVSLKTKLIKMTDPQQEKSFDMAFKALVDFACNEELAGYRPGTLDVKDPALADYLAGLLSQADIAVEQRSKLYTFDKLMDLMAEQIEGFNPAPNAMSVKGITIDSMRSFAQAACRFYQARSWKHLSDADLIRIEQPVVDSALRYATILGAGGEVTGVGFYESEQDHYSLVNGEGGASPKNKKYWTVFFDQITNLPLGDADLWEDQDLPVAGEDAYPIAAMYGLKGKVRRPRPDILAFLEGFLRALAETTEDEMDSGKWTKTVSTSEGEVEFALSLPGLLGEDESRPGDGSTARLPDPRIMEKTLRNIGRLAQEQEFESIDELNDYVQAHLNDDRPQEAGDRSPLDMAQDIIYQAFEASGRRQLRLVRKALEICPDCADAYVLHAERCSDPAEAYEWFLKGIQAGERALGAGYFEENAGHFWGMIETRPYMRSRLGLATCLDGLGRTEEAVEHYQEMLRLNPNDNQGVRDSLLPCLLAIDADDQAQQLLDKYERYDMAVWTYGQALVTFRGEGDTPAARRHLDKAKKTNRHVPGYLLGDEDVRFMPDSYSPGSKEEAIMCIDLLEDAWEETEGAIDWLESQMEE